MTILGFKQPKVLSMQTIIHLHLRQIIHLHGLELQENSHCSLVTLCTSCFRPRKLRMIESFKAEGLCNFFVATYFLKMLIWVLMLFLVFFHHIWLFGPVWWFLYLNLCFLVFVSLFHVSVPRLFFCVSSFLPTHLWFSFLVSPSIHQSCLFSNRFLVIASTSVPNCPTAPMLHLLQLCPGSSVLPSKKASMSASPGSTKNSWKTAGSKFTIKRLNQAWQWRKFSHLFG